MGKKRIIEEALIEASELEEASLANAKNLIIEKFEPEFVKFFSTSLNEEEDYDDEQGEVPGEQDTGPDEYEDEDTVDEAERDIGKEPDSGRQGTDPAVDDEDESLNQHQKNIQEADDEEDEDDDDDVDININLDDDDDEDDEGDDEDMEDDEDGDDEGDDELDVPDDLFDDEEDADDEDDEVEEEEDIDIELSDDFDDDDEEEEFDDEDDEEIDLDIEDDEESEMELDLDDEEEFEEGLYMRKEGEFQKVTPAEYFQTRIGELEEEKGQLSAALEAMHGQLEETHLFNAKLAHLNKLYMSGVFASHEKESIAERLDTCDTIAEVKSVYKTIVSEVNSHNPLDDFSSMLKENRVSKRAKAENIYESNDVVRMRRLAGLDD